MGVATGCGCKEVDFLILLIPTPLVSVLYSSIPTFSSFFECFSFFIIYTRLSTSGGYVLCQSYSNSNRQTFFHHIYIYRIFQNEFWKTFFFNSTTEYTRNLL